MRTRPLAFLLVTVTVTVVLALLPLAASAREPPILEKGYLRDNDEPRAKAPVAPDEKLWDDTLEAGIKHDQFGFDEAMWQMYHVPAGTSVLVLDVSVWYGRTKLRIL